MKGILIFLILIATLMSCRLLEKPRAITIVWENDKAVGLVIPKSRVRGYNAADIQVRLAKEGERIALLGTVQEEKEEFVFEPVVPLTYELQYEVMTGHVSIEVIVIPESEGERPHLTGAYPSQDTVPENLLKIHLTFSKPMAEGRSSDFLTLLKNDHDTVKGTFLDLQPELWNEEGSELTLWLDPGRIKLDLMPNKELGNPLEKGARYTLEISPAWRSKDGKRINALRAMSFLVAARDNQSPRPDSWRMTSPNAETNDVLTIDFGEALDYVLIQHTIKIVDSEKKPVAGKIQITGHQHVVDFIPDESWHLGRYFLQIEGRLEDLAGNNLNRLFEKDLLKEEKERKERGVFERKFEVK